MVLEHRPEEGEGRDDQLVLTLAHKMAEEEIASRSRGNHCAGVRDRIKLEVMPKYESILYL